MNKLSTKLLLYLTSIFKNSFFDSIMHVVFLAVQKSLNYFLSFPPYISMLTPIFIYPGNFSLHISSPNLYKAFCKQK